MYERVKIWNMVCCKEAQEQGTPGYWESLLNQLSRVQEELDETLSAIQSKDLVKLLDGGIDMDVTVAGFNYLSGFPYNREAQKVLDNNDLKFTRSLAKVDETFEKNKWSLTEYHIKKKGLFYSIHRISDDKVMKMWDHPEVVLNINEDK